MTGGTTTIADRVVEKIAGHAASEVSGAGGAARRVLGIAFGADERQDSPVVHAHVDGGVVTVDMEMSIDYPEPIAQVADAVRHRVEERVGGCTGLRVAQVDITITSLTSPSTTSSSKRVR